MTERPILNVSLADTVVRYADLLFSAVDAEMVIFQVKQDAYFSLDEIGADIWHRLEQPIGVGALCEALGRDYEAEPATIHRDVLALLNQMAVAELIRIAPP